MESHDRSSLAFLLFLGSALAVIATASAIPVTYDTVHPVDTTFIAMVAQWMHEGGRPGVDFSHFYPGLHERFVSLAYRLFGVQIKGLDYALALEALALGALILAASWRRWSLTVGGALFLLVTLTVFARAPAELHAQYDKIQSGHSFGYNRLGTGFAAVAAAVLLVPGRHRGSEVLGGAVIGSAVIAAMLCKSTFFPVVPVALVGLAIQARWFALGSATVVGVLVLMILDPLAAQTVNTLLYAVDSSGNSTGSDWLFRKYIKMIWSHQIQLMLLTAILAILWWAGPKGVWRTILSAVLFVGAFWAGTVTMGQPNHIGQQNVPVLVATGLAALAFISARAVGGGMIRALSLVLLAAFVVPQTAIFAVTSWKAATRIDDLAITEGPMRGYLVDEPLRDGKNRRVNVASTPLDERIEAATAAMKNGKNGSVYSYYAMADAVQILDGIDASELGLISDTRMGVGFFAGSRMVTHYPGWPRKDAKELREGYPMLSDTDMILFLRANPSKWTKIIEARMGDAFQSCRQSPFWELMVRERRDFCRE